GSLRHVADFSSDELIGFPILSADGRWLSFIETLPVGPGIVRTYPALLDLSTGAVSTFIEELGGNSSLESVVNQDGSELVISNQGDLDPRVGNADRSFELFLYDVKNDSFAQITDTLGGITGSINGCSPYRPVVSDGADVAAFGFYLGSDDSC